jgi:uncharacterized protein YkwD
MKEFHVMKQTTWLLTSLLMLSMFVAACAQAPDTAGTLIEPETSTQSEEEARAALPEDGVDEETVEQGMGIMNSDKPAALLAELNNARAENGCPALTPAPLLAVAAQGHAEDMAVRNFLNHTNPDGIDFSQRITNAGYGWSASGENIAAGVSEPAQVLQLWLNSPAHREAMLNCGYTEAAIGYAFEQNDQGNVVLPDGSNQGPFLHYWVLNLATPLQ